MSRRESVVGLGRVWNALIAAIVVIAIVVQLSMVVRGQHVLVEQVAGLPGKPTRILRFFSYFTIDSNLLCAITSATLALDPERDGRVWRVLRLNALVGITVTGIIYVTLLRPIVDLHGVAKLTDIAFHYVVPVATVLGWLLFRPRSGGGRRILDRDLLPSCIFPALYMVWTVVHGAIGHWYPYPFVDVNTLGYLVTLRNGLGVVVLLLGLSLLYLRADAWFAEH